MPKSFWDPSRTQGLMPIVKKRNSKRKLRIRDGVKTEAWGTRRLLFQNKRSLGYLSWIFLNWRFEAYFVWKGFLLLYKWSHRETSPLSFQAVLMYQIYFGSLVNCIALLPCQCQDTYISKAIQCLLSDYFHFLFSLQTGLELSVKVLRILLSLKAFSL